MKYSEVEKMEQDYKMLQTQHEALKKHATDLQKMLCVLAVKHGDGVLTITPEDWAPLIDHTVSYNLDYNPETKIKTFTVVTSVLTAEIVKDEATV